MIKIKNKYNIFMGIIFMFVFLFFAFNSDAAGISISPLTFEIPVNPGQTVENVIQVFNPTDDFISVVVEIEDFAPRGEEGQVVIISGFEEAYSIKSWLTLEPKTFTIEAGQTQIVKFIVNVPQNAEPGGHYGSILASVGGGGGAGTVGIAQKIGSLLLLNVAGDIEESMWIKEMFPIKKVGENFKQVSYFEYGPVTIRTRFENTGNIHLKPRGFVILKNIFGKETGREKLEELNVLPNSIRRVDSEFGKKWMFGKYTAEIVVIYGSTNEPLTFTTSFWVIPWKVTAGVSLGILFLLWFMLKARKRIRIAFRILFKGR